MSTESGDIMKGLEQKVLQKREAMEKLSPKNSDSTKEAESTKEHTEAALEGKHGSREVPTYNIFVGDLAPDCNAEDLRQAFMNCGAVHSCDVIRDRETGMSKRFGFVNFLSEEGQQNALGPDYTDIIIKGHRVRVNVSDSKATLYIGNLPRHLASNEVRSALELLAGPIVNLKLKEGYGFVTYVNAKRCVEASQRLQNQQIEGHPLIVQFPKDPKTKNLAKASDPFAAGKFTTPLSLYVNGLALTVTDSVLRSHFSKFGNVIRAVVVKNPEGKSRGFGFVEFDHPNSCETAVNCCDSTQLHGQSIHVAFARNKAPNDSPDWRASYEPSDVSQQLGQFHLDHSKSEAPNQASPNQASPNPALVSSRRLSMDQPNGNVVPTTFGAHLATASAPTSSATVMSSPQYDMNYMPAPPSFPAHLTMSPQLPPHTMSAMSSPPQNTAHISVPLGMSPPGSVMSTPVFMTRSIAQDSMVSYQASPQHPQVFINRIRIPPVPGNILSIQSPNLTPTSLSSASPMMSTPGTTPPKPYRRIMSVASSPTASMPGETPVFSRTPSETPVFSRTSPDLVGGGRNINAMAMMQQTSVTQMSSADDAMQTVAPTHMAAARSGATTPEVECMGPTSASYHTLGSPVLTGISEDGDSMAAESATSSATAAAVAAHTAAAILAQQQQQQGFEPLPPQTGGTMVTSLDAYGRPMQTIQLPSPMTSPTMQYNSLNFGSASPFNTGGGFIQLPNGQWAMGSPTIMGGQATLGQVNGMNVVGVPVAVPVMVPAPYNGVQAPIVGLRKPSVYIGNLPLNMTASQLQPIFESMVGPFQQLHLKKGYCFLSFNDHSEAATAAAALNNRTIEGRRLNAQIARERLAFMYPRHVYANLPSDGSIHFPASSSFQQAQSEDRTLYVGNIPPHVTEAALSDHFSVFGDVVRAIVSVDSMTGLSRGYGFIEYKTKDPCEKAVAQLHGTEFEGSVITVKLSEKLAKGEKNNDDGSVSVIPVVENK